MGYLLRLSRCRFRCCRFILLINVLVCLVVFTRLDIDKIIAPRYKNITKELIDERLRSHAQFFEQASSSFCDTMESLTTEQKQYYDRMMEILPSIRQGTIPSYPGDQFHGRGIVLSVDAAQISQYMVNLKMIEYIETHLPVQLWYSSNDLSNSTVIDLLHHVPKLRISACSFTTAQCQTINQTWSLDSTYVYPPLNRRDPISKHLSSRPAAILSATFSEILFLDIDSFLVRDPDYLFQFDPMYRQFGALFFPDARTSKHPSVIWKLLNITCARTELDFDSRTFLVNKERVWKALYMTKLISDQYDFSETYRDTFRLAFRLTDVRYYMVGLPCSTGYYNGSHFCGFTMCHADSMGQHIFVNHLNLMKFINAGYSSYHFGSTRMGLGDPYDHPFSMQYCSSQDANSCLFLDTLDQPNGINECMTKSVDQREIESHAYNDSEALRIEESQHSRMFMSETNNLMSGFLSSLFHYQRQIYGNF